MSIRQKNPPELDEDIGIKTRTYIYTLSSEARENTLRRFWASASSKRYCELELLGKPLLGVVGSVFEATHPSFAFQSRNVRSRDSVHILPMSVGHGCEAREMISDALGEAECSGRRAVKDERKEPCWKTVSVHSSKEIETQELVQAQASELMRFNAYRHGHRNP